MTTALPHEQEFETIDLNINVGPQHPSTHGVFRMVLLVDGEKVVDVVPHVGYMHRGAEKLCENMDYRQGIGYMDRTEYLGQLNAEIAYCIAAEKLSGIQVPERAEYIRVIGAELNRLASHFMFMGAFGTDAGYFGTAFTYAFREREYIQDLLEEVSGDRIMFNYFHVGGLAWDVPENFEERCRWVLKQTRQGIKDVDGLMTRNEIFIARCRGIGIISKAEALDWALSGPMLRACGFPIDVR